MSMFRLKLYDFVNKPQVVRTMEHKALEFVNEMNDQQKLIALFLRKLVYVNKVLVLNINNYTNQINEIKVAHHSVVNFLRTLLNKYYVLSAQLVENLEDTFKCMSDMELLKNNLVQRFMLITAKPIEMRYLITNNSHYQNYAIRLLMLMQKFRNIYEERVKI